MYEIKMPKFGLTMDKGHIERWLKKEGEYINKGESLLEVSSDKISNEIISPISGFLLKIWGQEGEEYPVGQTIAIVGEKQELDQANKEVSEIKSKEIHLKQDYIKTDRDISKDSRIIASPSAKRLAREHHILLSQVQGSGPGGRITSEDILSFLNHHPKDNFKVEKLSGIRKTIIERLSQSFHQAITLTNITEVDFTQLKKQTKLNQVSITTGIIFVLSKILLNLKKFNSHFENEQLKEYNIVNIGLAVDTDRGLLVPVLKNAHLLDLKNIQEKIIDLSSRARTNQLNEGELYQSTFTITNLGMMRTDLFTPILNPPEVAILGIGRIIKKPCIVDEDKIAIREMAYLSLSYDHRIIDGADAARFLGVLAQSIEDPESLLMNNKGVE
ncbi:MAG: 2-oxo acid dehydrogenase subunit E2 [Candidatus Atribacteria bacterium]|nr:2-oxo acid dehydrogenase subunit E2 [Candidatus Atribacteria bacterium]